MILSIPKYFKQKHFKISGVYFLLSRGKIVYIGATTNIINRIMAHKMTKTFDTIRIIPCPKNKLNYYEKRWIIRFRPRYNRQYVELWK